MFKLFVIAVLIALAGAGWLHLRRRRQQEGTALLGGVAQIFGGQLLPAHRDENWGTVRFSQGGHELKLRREERVREGAVEACCVVELTPGAYRGPALELLAHDEAPSRLLPPERTEIDTGVEAWRGRVHAWAAPEVGPRLQSMLDDKETRRLLGYALDKKGARLHLSSRGAWFECSGFPENRELIAAIARTAAEALVRLLQRAAL